MRETKRQGGAIVIEALSSTILRRIAPLGLKRFPFTFVHGTPPKLFLIVFSESPSDSTWLENTQRFLPPARSMDVMDSAALPDALAISLS